MASTDHELPLAVCQVLQLVTLAGYLVLLQVTNTSRLCGAATSDKHLPAVWCYCKLQTLLAGCVVLQLMTLTDCLVLIQVIDTSQLSLVLLQMTNASRLSGAAIGDKH